MSFPAEVAHGIDANEYTNLHKAIRWNVSNTGASRVALMLQVTT